MSSFVFKPADKLLSVGDINWIDDNIKAILVSKAPNRNDSIKNVKKYKCSESVQLANKSLYTTEYNMTFDADDLLFPTSKSSKHIDGVVIYRKDIPIVYIGCGYHGLPYGGTMKIEFSNGVNKIFTSWR